MKTRIISALVLFPILFIAIFMGNGVLMCGTLALSLIAMHEFYSAFKQYKPIKGLGYFFTLILYIYLYIKQYYNLDEMYMLNIFFNKFNQFDLLLLLIIVLIIILVLTYPKYTVIDIAITMFGFVYIPVFFSLINIIRNGEFGNWLVWFIFLSAWGSDTFAYFTGRALGKHKLAPALSPNKTIEGAVGGVIGAIVLCIIFSIIVQNYVNIDNSNFILISGLVGAVGAGLSIAGDLVASSIKRYCNIKDFGYLIPGHGGIMDRFDSILLSAPVVYFVLKLL